MRKSKTILPLIGCILLALLFFGLTREKNSYQRTYTSYQVPDVTLVNQHNQPVPLRTFLAPDKPLMLEFIFTSCTTLCPNQSVKFSNFQKRLAPDTEQVRLVSITVDPETDTPEVLLHYLKQYQAQPGWEFLTGSKKDIKLVMNAFGIKPSDMITLDSSLLLRSTESGKWVRIDGQVHSEDFYREYQRLIQ
ncbi:protein SCO1/2 [Malonomonas rubra DSM 5091]|uniref:Protein SCO1/2 n=1 Tax=Malonomonas rubra DSM 5091 TaxID=1122189 RepID=A0A1M6H755_MALRU|nr:SCO family protein [Malonomonas rubra]SHJ18025.1 protein SCO1/2 [Malonomonas rubra DSM 5091]